MSMSDERLLKNIRRCLSLAQSAEQKAVRSQTEGERFHHLDRADKHRLEADNYRKELAARVGISESFTILHNLRREVQCTGSST